jgi:hypothetical protein
LFSLVFVCEITIELLTDTLKSWMAFTTSANIFLSDDLREVEIYFQEAVFLSLKKNTGWTEQEANLIFLQDMRLRLDFMLSRNNADRASNVKLVLLARG